jgi:hypothetical protein
MSPFMGYFSACRLKSTRKFLKTISYIMVQNRIMQADYPGSPSVVRGLMMADRRVKRYRGTEMSPFMGY